MTHIEARTSGIGFQVHGVNLGELDDAGLSVIKKAFARSGLVFIRDQDLSPEQHIAFARRFGPIETNRFFKAVEGYPEIAQVGKEPDQTVNIGGGWHTDHSYDAEPAMGSILYARVVPESGGDTLFASMYRAYDALSGGLKQTLAGLRAVHSSRHIFGPDSEVYREASDRIGNASAATQDAVHPVVITHPLSGRRALFVNPIFTTHFEGWTPKESKGLLAHLYQHASRPEFGCRFQWAPGSVAIWDNRATWHYALNDYHGQRRLMHRITIAGEPLS
jgi:taurine dioxygenase